MTISFSHLYNETIDNIMTSRTYRQIKNSLWKPYLDAGQGCSKLCAKNLRILILNAPCNGFGDLIFAMKLSNYLKEWYGAHVTIATTFEKGLLSLGANPQYVVGLTGGKRTQCRRFNLLKMNKNIPEQDLIFIAPIQIDFNFSITDVKKIIPYANEFNTFSFSEYNDSISKDFTFNTGIGRNRDGLMLTKPNKRKTKPKGLKNPYALIYIAASLEGVDKCILAFAEMIVKKYNKIHKKLDIVIPSWFAQKHINDKLINKISKFYPNILLVDKDKKVSVINEGNILDNNLIFRCDILPVPNNLMMQLISNSIDDILLTGDQSITDALSCCSNKNIFYQIAPWKRDLAKNLAKNMPNVYLKSVKTSCGTLKAINYRSNYNKFVREWDFRKRAKPKVDAIVLSALAIKKNNDIADLVKLVSKSKNINSIKNNIEKLDYADYNPKKKSKRVSRRRRSKRVSRRRRSKRVSRRRRSKRVCSHGVKKDGECKKKPGPKKNNY